MKEELATLSQSKQTLKDSAFTERVMKPESSNMSILGCVQPFNCFITQGVFFQQFFCCSTVPPTAQCRHVSAGERGDGKTAG